MVVSTPVWGNAHVHSQLHREISGEEAAVAADMKRRQGSSDGAATERGNKPGAEFCGWKPAPDSSGGDSS